MPTKTQIEAQAAAYRALEPLLPEILKLGISKYLATQPPTKELGLSAAKEKKPEPAPVTMEAVVDWQNMPNADLLEERSEASVAEKLRRSFEAFEAFNKGSQMVLAPMGQAVASLADVDAAYAAAWLERNGHNPRLREYLEQLGFESALAAEQANREAMSRANQGRPKSYRDFIKWDEGKYGPYRWA